MNQTERHPVISYLALLFVAFLSLGSVFPVHAGIMQTAPDRLLAQTPAETVRFDNLSEDDGLSNNQVQAILQDQTGSCGSVRKWSEQIQWL